MDNAVLSARFAVQAILMLKRRKQQPYHIMRKECGQRNKKMEENQEKRQVKFASDETLATSLTPNQMLKDGIKIIAANIANKFLPPEEIFTLPF